MLPSPIFKTYYLQHEFNVYIGWTYPLKNPKSHTRIPSSSPLSTAISSPVKSKSNISKFCRSLPGFVLLGIAATPRSKIHFNSTCAGVLLRRPAIFSTSGFSNRSGILRLKCKKTKANPPCQQQSLALNIVSFYIHTIKNIINICKCVVIATNTTCLPEFVTYYL